MIWLPVTYHWLLLTEEEDMKLQQPESTTSTAAANLLNLEQATQTSFYLESP